MCPTCRTENPSHKIYCRECGGKLVLTCPQCGSENLPGDNFCGECGQVLGAPSKTPPPKSLAFFRFERLGEKSVKGKEAPVKVYRVISPSSLRTRFDVSAEQGLTPFIGRQRELELLLDVYERAKSGRGQAASIVADAGMGKSRLLYEFRKAIANEEVTFLEGKCLSYSRGTAYHPVIDLLKGQFNIRESDGDLEVRNKVKQGLKLLQIDEVNTLSYFLELLSVKDSGIDQIPLSPEGKRDQTLQALTRIVLKGAEIQPLILAVEIRRMLQKSIRAS